MSDYTQEQREQAARQLGRVLKLIEGVQMAGAQLSDDEANMADAYRTAIAALREQGWVKTAERLPTVLDTDDEGKVPILTRGMLTGSWIRITLFYKAVTTDTAEYFLPLPREPEEEHERQF